MYLRGGVSVRVSMSTCPDCGSELTLPTWSAAVGKAKPLLRCQQCRAKRAGDASLRGKSERQANRERIMRAARHQPVGKGWA
jgi:hypothetical protein